MEDVARVVSYLKSIACFAVSLRKLDSRELFEEEHVFMRTIDGLIRCYF